MATVPDVRDCPPEVLEFAEQTARYALRSLGSPLDYGSDTLPLLDHYVGQVPTDKPSEQALVASAAGAYFGEVLRRVLGGSWDTTAGEPLEWKLVLPGGLSLCPAALVLAAITRTERGRFDGPPRLLAAVKEILDSMAEVSQDTYYSLSGRYDTLEHLQETLLAVASARTANAN